MVMISHPSGPPIPPERFIISTVFILRIYIPSSMHHLTPCTEKGIPTHFAEKSICAPSQKAHITSLYVKDRAEWVDNTERGI